MTSDQANHRCSVPAMSACAPASVSVAGISNQPKTLIGLPSAGGNQVAANDYRKEQEIKEEMTCGGANAR
ncbi:Uncharacterised protein [Salmonella enterica subsp. enterica]|nr:Uncharacterised protein [Salmonella enterica subsp. enterica]